MPSDGKWTDDPSLGNNDDKQHSRAGERARQTGDRLQVESTMARESGSRTTRQNRRARPAVRLKYIATAAAANSASASLVRKPRTANLFDCSWEMPSQNTVATV